MAGNGHRSGKATMLGDVDILVHTPPGSGPEAMIKALISVGAEVGEDTTGWMTESCTGGHGVTAMRRLAARAGDATIISTCTPSFVQTPLLEGLTISYRDLTPLACLMLERYLVLVRADDAISTPAEFLANLEAKKTVTGGYLRGGINHLAGLALADATGGTVEFIQVETAQHLLPALLRRELDWVIATPKEAASALAARTVRAVALLAAEPSTAFPGLSTLNEAGVQLTLSVWRGLMAPPGISSELQLRWQDLLLKIVRSQRWAEFLGPGVPPTMLFGRDFTALLDEQQAWYIEQFGRAGLLGRRES